MFAVPKKSTGRARPRLWWCPTGQFAFLPVHAASFEYVLSSYTPTLEALRRAQPSAVSPTRLNLKALIVAEPFSPGLPAIYNVVDEITYAESALASIRPIVVGNLDLSQRDRQGATKQAVLGHLKDSQVSILHLACHGQQDKEQPLESGFCLRDGKLTIAALMELKMTHAFLAVLSACETAKGDRSQPDQVVHLAAAMLFVGFKSVLATMW